VILSNILTKKITCDFSFFFFLFFKSFNSIGNGFFSGKGGMGDLLKTQKRLITCRSMRERSCGGLGLI
jgi:hypothetical protein